MSNKEILEKAIQKAVKRGWDMYDIFYIPQGVGWHVEGTKGVRLDTKTIPNASPLLIPFNEIMWRHDFAQALWGNEPYHHVASSGDTQYNKNGEIIGVRTNHEYNWAYHLQNMVISEDRIKYLEENI